MMLSFVILASLLLAAQFTSGQPTVNFPINSQLPPVARVDEPFSYSFSRYTFRSDFNLSYSLGDAPKWLSIDDEGQLYGTPTDDTVPEGDVVGQQVEIIADDGAGSASLTATLVVSRSQGPSVKIPLSDQIGGFGDYSAPSSLISYPSTEFSFSFDSDTFNHQPNMINYYATSGNSSPLPAWVRFDAGSLTFSGTTPPFESLVQPPQTFDFDLVASDIVGFSAVSMSFSITVGRHKLSADNPTITLNTTRGKKLRYDGLEGSVRLDNEPVDKSDVEVSVDNMPEWLSLDEETWRIEGTPKEGDHSTNFTINLRDSHQDTLAIDAVVNVATALFRSTFDDIEIRAGKEANIDLKPYFWDPDDVTVEISIRPDIDWLKLEGFNITGKAPRSASRDLKISVTASSKGSDATETETLNVSLLAFTPTPSLFDYIDCAYRDHFRARGTYWWFQ
ncbi:polarity establishment/cellular polarization [Fusarium piperis]|uniref:Polarity establishment/cellular polarization n=1 Tax=Fusarium piperis TaxID=1435070 RepID=A0A9W8W3P1_9HYPO|nr:polarity establishment/cellular polarization [Fusarium piperis]